MVQRAQLNNPQWGITLPRPNDRVSTHEPRAEPCHEVNPAYLSYWKPDGVGRAFYFWTAAMLGLVSSSVMAFTFLSEVLGRGYLYQGEPFGPLEIGLTIFFVSLPIISAVSTYLSVRLPLQPPTYLNRKLRRAYAWHGDKKLDGGWMYIDWDKVIPVARRVQLSYKYGTETLYVLHLLEVDPRTKAILKTIALFAPQRDPAVCGEVWEYIRRYMNGTPEDLPPARIDWRLGGFRGVVIRLHESAFDDWLRPDGTLRFLAIDFIFAPFMVAAIYVFIGVGLWLERIVPKQKVPAELEQANRWKGDNPYPVYDGSPEEQQVLKVRAIKVLPVNVVLMAVSLILHLACVAVLVMGALG